jgi:lysophospholipase L1-like esterase
MKSLLLTGALLLSLRTLAQHSAIDPVPRSDKWWQERHAGFNQRVSEVGEKASVIFIGDSITQGWEGEGKEVWARYYAPRNAVNLGIGGDRTQHVLWRLDNGNLKGLKPKAAVLMIGTNNSNGEDNTPGQIVDGVAAIVKKLRATLPDTKILLLAIFPRSENFSAQRGKLAQINQVLRRFADEEHVFWIDFGHRFLSDDGSMPRSLMPDYLHLSPAGYQIWAESIEGSLSKILGDASVTSQGGLDGDWIWTIAGPDGQPVSAQMILKTDGEKVTGRFQRGEDRWLQIENGRVSGNEFSWTVKRDRPGGGTMTYDMNGKLENGAITGAAKAEMDGNPITSPWSAKRK